MSVLTIDRLFVCYLNHNLNLRFQQVDDIDTYLSKAKLLGIYNCRRARDCAIVEGKETQTVISETPIQLINDISRPSSGLFFDARFPVIDLSNTTLISDSTRGMFKECKSKEIHLEGMRAPYLETMYHTFLDAEALVINIDGIITKNTRYLAELFARCFTVKHISMKNSDTSRVTSIAAMFDRCINLESVDGLLSFNIESITNETKPDFTDKTYLASLFSYTSISKIILDNQEIQLE